MSDNIPHHWKDSVCLNCGEAGSFDGPCLSRASNAALKAENEALKDNVCGSDCVRDRAQLAQYTSWQPSDPGTKEAMKTCRPQSDEEGEKRMSWVDTAMTLSRALTAAMVRLEEAEKDVDKMRDHINERSAPSSDSVEELKRKNFEMYKHADAGWKEADAQKERVIRYAAKAAQMEGVCEDREKWKARAEAFESQLSALTASLAEVRKLLTRDCVHCGQENWTATPAPKEESHD